MILVEGRYFDNGDYWDDVGEGRRVDLDVMGYKI